jgi:hypothetical protein
MDGLKNVENYSTHHTSLGVHIPYGTGTVSLTHTVRYIIFCTPSARKEGLQQLDISCTVLNGETNADHGQTIYIHRTFRDYER